MTFHRGAIIVIKTRRPGFRGMYSAFPLSDTTIAGHSGQSDIPKTSISFHLGTTAVL